MTARRVAASRVPKDRTSGFANMLARWTQRCVHLASILAKPDVLSFGTLDAATRRAVIQGGLAERACGVLRQTVHLDRDSGQLGVDFDKQHRVLRKRQHKGRTGECERSHKRLQVETIRDCDHWRKGACNTKRAQKVGRCKN